MDNKEKQILINRIVCDTKIVKLDNVIYKVRQPNLEQRVIADLIYQDIIDNNKYETFLNENNIRIIQKIKGLWTDENEKTLKEYEKTLEELKVSLFKNFMKIDNKNFIKKQIKSIKNKIQELEDQKYLFEQYTIEYHATSVREKYLLGINIEKSGIKLFSEDNVFDTNNNLIFNIQKSIYDNYIITPEQYRLIARSEPWKSLWSIGKDNIFNKPAVEYTIEQKYLLMYSKMYENASSAPEPPTEAIINDDDAFDGWLIHIHKQNDSEKHKRFVEANYNIKDNADEVFILSKKDEAQDIYSLNDQTSRMKVLQRERYIKEKDFVGASELPDIQMQLQQQTMSEFKKKLKG